MFFRGSIEGAGATYLEWTNQHRENAVLHAHILSDDRRANFEKVVAEGSSSSNSREFFTFWINQDTIVDEHEFRELIKDALSRGINAELLQQRQSGA